MADSIHVKLPDGSVKDVPKGTTALDIAKSIGQRLADAAIAAKTNGDLIDLTRPLEKDTELRILTEKDPEAPGDFAEPAGKVDQRVDGQTEQNHCRELVHRLTPFRTTSTRQNIRK